MTFQIVRDERGLGWSEECARKGARVVLVDLLGGHRRHRGCGGGDLVSGEGRIKSLMLEHLFIGTSDVASIRWNHELLPP